MLRICFLTILLTFSCHGFTKSRGPLYQIDMIVFTHPSSNFDKSNINELELPPPDLTHAITLSEKISDTMTPYHPLPLRISALRDEFYALNHKPQFQVLFQRSWLQPANNQQPIALAQTNASGWDILGTLRVRRSNYYLLDTELRFIAPNSPRSPFVFAQKQRLKPGVVYYLDHPEAGMLIKIHQVG